MASKLKRDLMALQAGKNMQIMPMSKASKTAMMATTATVSKSKNHPKAGGTAKIGTKHPTGAARSGQAVPKAKSKTSGLKYFTPTPTGKATPSAKVKTTGKSYKSMPGF